MEEALQACYSAIDKAKEEAHIQGSRGIEFSKEKCSICNMPMTGTTVHFRCGHEMHESCLEEDNYECSLCSHAHTQTIQLSKYFEEKKLDLNQLNDDLYNVPEDSISAVERIKNYYGIGLFNNAKFY